MNLVMGHAGPIMNAVRATRTTVDAKAADSPASLPLGRLNRQGRPNGREAHFETTAGLLGKAMKRTLRLKVK